MTQTLHLLRARIAYAIRERAYNSAARKWLWPFPRARVRYACGFILNPQNF
jgi:hypothetical protein